MYGGIAAVALGTGASLGGFMLLTGGTRGAAYVVWLVGAIALLLGYRALRVRHARRNEV